MKEELSQKAKLSIYWSTYVPILTYGHDLWVVTKRMRSRIQAAENGLSLRDGVRGSVIREGLGVEPLLLRIELRWLGHLVRMPPGPRTRWRDYVSRLGWERLGVPPEELEGVAGDRDVWVSLLKPLPPRPDPRTSGR